MKFCEAVEIFLRKKAAKNIAMSSIDYYETVFKVFERWLKQNGSDCLEEISDYTIQDYLIYISNRYSPATVKGRYIALATLFNYLIKARIINDNPMYLLEMPKLPKKLIPSFTSQEVRKILEHYDRSTFIGRRNYTIMLTLLGTGLRKSELLSLRCLDIEGDMLRITGKGGKERLVPLGRALRFAFREYIHARNQYLKELKTDNYMLWITKDGNQLSITGFNEIFYHLRDAYGNWTTRVSAHTFRHTFAKSYLKNGGNLFSLQQILGHEDISTTRIYVDLNDSDIRSQHAQFNPLDNSHWKYL